MIELKLKPREDRRLRAGHLWVYSNELQTDAQFRAIAPGSLCRVSDDRGKPLGVGYVNPHALLSVRILAGNADTTIDAAWFARRIEAALALRQRLYDAPFYRLVHGESDGLPGLVVDRYGDWCAVQLGTAGMENLKAEVIQALQDVLKPRGILLRNDGGLRELEGLPAYVETVGEVPDEVELLESGVRFVAPLKSGQKTGWFYDQHDNRDRLGRYVRGARVLDVFSYVGGWAIRSAAFGASAVTCIDSSQPALDAARRAAALNGFEIETIRDDALDALKQLRREQRQFEVVVVDPPALIKRKKDYEAGLEHYAALNRAALQLLPADGILIACSCSHHLEAEALQRILLRESRNAGRRLQILEQGAQSADHPVHPAIPETRYLKAYTCRVLAS
ncbi:class I SAM-dependent rRNA methyltransferase [Solimonas sp. K1W22B-7]|uniref:class I SAM-dependent rRNA methyltransferase n=1 Tax=Solimonas sp. K1W22B-7 TaxID=2303331 RepID=UPI000E335CB7|nr:class I SAM-dependent rRNA methyltransferase [Solimonas sp. K1W22B-7]AXQ29773.1 class I SAM-dependent rRNA methyltransferase [Solimonas sp. K1W22B-7]